jgi:hypothetical protein
LKRLRKMLHILGIEPKFLIWICKAYSPNFYNGRSNLDDERGQCTAHIARPELMSGLRGPKSRFSHWQCLAVVLNGHSRHSRRCSSIARRSGLPGYSQVWPPVRSQCQPNCWLVLEVAGAIDIGEEHRIWMRQLDMRSGL